MAKVRIVQNKTEYTKANWKPKSHLYKQKYLMWRTFATVEILIFILVFVCRAG